MYHLWQRCILYLTGIRYTLKLLRFTYQNVLVLRHFQRCREVESAVTQTKKTRFPYLDFYRRTWQQSRKLFTPVPTSTTRVSPIRQGLHSVTEGAIQDRISQNSSVLLQSADLSVRSALYSHDHHSHISAPTKRKAFRIRTTLKKSFLAIWHAPRYLVWKLGAFFRTRIFKVKLSSLYQQQQIELLRERHRLIASTQTALFLSLANSIDLHTTRELTTLCQHVGRARRKRKMTAEDLACFDQSVTDLDKNHETLRHAA
jgi:hypothetical protein